LGFQLPLWGRKETGVVIEGQEQHKKSDAISAVVNTIDLDYFSTLDVPFVKGRDFTQDDRDSSAPVAIINDTMAAEFWPTRIHSASVCNYRAAKDSSRSSAS